MPTKVCRIVKDIYLCQYRKHVLCIDRESKLHMRAPVSRVARSCEYIRVYLNWNLKEYVRTYHPKISFFGLHVFLTYA